MKRITRAQAARRDELLTRLGIVALFVALLIAAVESQATVVVMHDLDEMTRRSDLVVQARVTGQRVTREDGRIVTLTEVEVVDGIKGAKYGDVLTIYQVGGVLDGVTALISGMHEYWVGEELILFGMRHGRRVVSYGVGVGKFQIQYDGSLAKVVEDITDVVALKRTAEGELRFEPPEPRTAEDLDEFKGRLRRFVREQAGPRPKLLGPKGDFHPRALGPVPGTLHKKPAGDR